LVPEGRYRLAYVSWEKGCVYGREVWFVLFQITEEGSFFGLLVLRYYNAPKRPWLPRSSSLALDFEAISGGLRPPANLRPDMFLKGCEVLAEVATVRHRIQGSRRVEIPETRRYSKVDRIIRLTAGSPPILTGRQAGKR
jgi:hypothetical protein